MNKHISIPELNFDMEFIYVKPGKLNFENKEIIIKKPYFLAKYPATNMAISKVIPPVAINSFPRTNLDMHTVHQICFHLNNYTQRNLIFDVPTTDEWMYACCAGVPNDLFCSPAELKDYAWFGDNSGSKEIDTSQFVANFTTKEMLVDQHKCKIKHVGTKKPNPWGFHDMLGNVWEWCCSKTDNDYESTLKGGSFLSLRKYISIAFEQRAAKSHRDHNIGCRLVLRIKETAINL